MGSNSEHLLSSSFIVVCILFVYFCFGIDEFECDFYLLYKSLQLIQIMFAATNVHVYSTVREGEVGQGQI